VAGDDRGRVTGGSRSGFPARFWPGQEARCRGRLSYPSSRTRRGCSDLARCDRDSGRGPAATVEAIAAEIKVGSIFEGKVVSTRDFGAFIEIAPGTDGMCHISELADGFVDKVENICKVGDKIKVKVIAVDDTGRIKLSVKALLKDAAKEAEKETVEN